MVSRTHAGARRGRGLPTVARGRGNKLAYVHATTIFNHGLQNVVLDIHEMVDKEFNGNRRTVVPDLVRTLMDLYGSSVTIEARISVQLGNKRALNLRYVIAGMIGMSTQISRFLFQNHFYLKDLQKQPHCSVLENRHELEKHNPHVQGPKHLK